MLIFAKDLEAMAAFYADAIGLRRRETSAPGFVEMLRGSDVVLALHQVPEAIAEEITITRPPQRREDSAMKACLEVADIDATRAAVLEHGGLADATWDWEGRRYCECADLEGNPLQLFVA